MASVSSRRLERAKSLCSLVCLLQGLEGREATVELRNECSVTGHIDHVDGFMNTHMSDVVFVDMFGTSSKMEKFYVKGTKIRFVQIPDDMNIIETIDSSIKSIRSAISVPAGQRKAFVSGATDAERRSGTKLHHKFTAANIKPNLMQKDKAGGKERFLQYMKNIESEKKEKKTQLSCPKDGKVEVAGSDPDKPS